MNAHVDLKPSGPRVTLLAPKEGTVEWFKPSMRLFVSLKVAFSNEALPAKLALERTITGVGPHVCLQVARLRELLQALLEGAEQNLCLVARLLDLFYHDVAGF